MKWRDGLGSILVAWMVAALAGAPTSASTPAEPGELVPRQPLAKERIFLARGPDGIGIPPHQVIVKFGDAVRARVSDHGAVYSETGASLSEWAALQRRFGFWLEPLIRQSAARLAAIEARAALRSGRAQPDLAGMYVVRTGQTDAASLLVLAESLGELDTVEFVELMRTDTPPPADIRPTTPDHTNLQDYRDPDPGMNLPVDATGVGVRLSDCEYGWVASHEDLEDIDLHPEPGQTVHPTVVVNGWDEHGTAALGSSAAAVNDYGVSGIAPGAEFYTYSEWTVEGGPRRVTAVTNAIMSSAAGDVVLLEMQAGGAGGGFGPAELSLAVWTVVKMGTDAGVVVVGAAGNGNQDLDSEPYEEYRDRGDSGAIIVGAGTADVAHDRLGFSTFGARVDVQGWGRSVFTLGYGSFAEYGGDKNQRYTATFAGTSSASGLVAGAVTVVQSAAIATLGAPSRRWSCGNCWSIRDYPKEQVATSARPSTSRPPSMRSARCPSSPTASNRVIHRPGLRWCRRCPDREGPKVR